MIELLLDHGADPALKNTRDGRSATEVAARRGRGDVLTLLQQELHGVDRLIAACARGERAGDRQFLEELIAGGGTLLAEFAGNGNVEGLRCLLDLGVSAAGGRERIVERGAPVNALDGKGRTALALAVKVCVDSPDSVEALLKAGATVGGIGIPSGYEEVDQLLRRYRLS